MDMTSGFNGHMNLTQRGTTWILFAALFFCAPAFYLLILAVGVLPPLGIFLAVFDSLQHTRGGLLELGMLFILFVEAIIWSVIYAFVSFRTSQFILSLQSPARTIATVVVVLGVFALSLLPLCISRTVHSRRNPTSWMQILREYVKPQGGLTF